VNEWGGRQTKRFDEGCARAKRVSVPKKALKTIQRLFTHFKKRKMHILASNILHLTFNPRTHKSARYIKERNSHLNDLSCTPLSTSIEAHDTWRTNETKR
jgi:hypothetical protein